MVTGPNVTVELSIGMPARRSVRRSRASTRNTTSRGELDHVVVGAGLQADQTIFLLATCGQHDHARMITAAPSPAQHLQSRQTGQHDVQDHDVRADPLPELRGLATIAAAFDLISGSGEIGP